MADCDLCGVSLPTLNPVKVLMLRFASAYPKGMWTGVCDDCIKSAHEVYGNVSSLNGSNGKCDLCGTTLDLYPVEIEIPSFSKGVDPAVAQLCKGCLEASSKVHVIKENEPKSEHH